MQPELLFFAIIIIWRIAFRNKSEVISWFSDSYYLAWFILSISTFDYTPRLLQYGIRLFAIFFGLFAVSTDGLICLFPPTGVSTATLYIIYLAYCGISTIWSVDALQTAVKVTELFVDVLVISKAIEEDGLDIAARKFVKIIITGSVLIEVYSIAGFIFMNGTFFHDSNGLLGRQLSGIIVSSDTLCGIMALIICYYLNFRKGFWDNVVLALAFAVIFLGQARTSLVCATIMVIIYFFRTNKKLFYMGFLAIVALVAYSNWDTIYTYFVRGSTNENLQNLTGRRVMWNWAKQYIAEKPCFGYGFGSGGEIVSSRIGMTSLHSGIYETIIGTGYIGFVQMVAIYVLTLLNIAKNVINHGIMNNLFEIMLMIMLTIGTYMGGGIGGWQGQSMMLFLVIIFGFSFDGALETLTMRCETKETEYAGNGDDQYGENSY